MKKAELIKIIKGMIPWVKDWDGYYEGDVDNISNIERLNLLHRAFQSFQISAKVKQKPKRRQSILARNKTK